MRFPATPGWGPLAAVVCGRLPLLAAGPGRGSPPLLAGESADGGVGFAPATPGCGPQGRLPATPGWGPPAAAVGVSAGGGFLCCVCLWRGVCVWCLSWCVWCGVCSWCLCWLWCGRGGCAFRVCLCVCLCLRVWCVGGVRGGAVWCVGGGVAGVWSGWSLATPGGGSCVLLAATPAWFLLPVVVGVPRHSWLRVSGAAPRHSWLGSAGHGGRCFRGWGFPVLCVLVARHALVCALCVCGCGVGVGLSSVCAGVCVAACGV